MTINPKAHTLDCKRVPNEIFGRLGYVRLDKNEKSVGYPEEFVQEMFQGVTPDMLSSYPEPFILQKKLAQFLGVEEDRILLTSGSDAAIKTCFETFIDSGDKVVRLDPTYAMIGVYSKLFGAKEIKGEYNNSLNLDFNGLIGEIRNGAKLVYIANPNSPTGTVMSLDQLRLLCREAKSIDAVVVVDEAYQNFSSISAFTLLDQFENLAIVRTFSKAAGLASVRLGYIISSPEIINWLSRWRPMYEINSFAQHCGCFILDHWEYVEQYVKEILSTREWFIEKINKKGLLALESHANFVLVKYPKEKISNIVDKFKEEGILIKGGGNSFPLSETLRFSIGTRPQMKRCIEILNKLSEKE